MMNVEIDDNLVATYDRIPHGLAVITFHENFPQVYEFLVSPILSNDPLEPLPATHMPNIPQVELKPSVVMQVNITS